LEFRNQIQYWQKKKTRGGVMSNLPNLREDVNNLLREVVGDDKNDKKRVANLNEENSDDEEVLLS
jgi:predicted membrane chloride channel (bestrophin family)